ncbi:cation:proton antiporter [Ferruginivarius sediminum]|uniref:cation:proton antiporter n=1 Tax=Ferruginivarius sediminum TaxID=2661937 RepID=UPI0011C07D57|nr:sodium:proton antiporter [Ferruginivarius sediminum]
MEHLLVAKLALIAGVGVGAQWLAWRLHAPAVILLALGGILIGPVLGWLRPAEDFGPMLGPFVGLSVAVILFEGGLNLKLRELRSVGTAVPRLLFLAAPITWGLTALAGHYVAGFSWSIAILVGALLVITGPTVIGPLLRQAKLERDTSAMLKWEGILNDPLGAILAVLVFEALTAAHADTPARFAIGAAVGIAVAAAVGLGLGLGFAWLTRRGHIAEFLKAPALIGLVAAAYALGNAVQAEAGLIAVTLLGACLANKGLASIEQIRRFKEYVGVLLVSALFVVLAATLEAGMLAELDWGIAGFVLLLLFAIRPLSVWLATLGGGLDWRRRLLVGWIAPRGIVVVAVTGVFAPALARQGYAGAEALVPLAFAVVFATVVAHGATVKWLGRRLGLAAGPEHGVLIVGATPWSTHLAQALRNLGLPVLLADTNPHHLVAAEEAGLDTFCGEILSELADQRLDLTRFEHLVAATDNDAYNALVASQFAPELGTNRTFQLASHPEVEPQELRQGARGRELISAELDSDQLDARLAEGWTFGCQRIAKGKAPVWKEEDATAVAWISPGGEVHFRSAEAKFAPGDGDAVLIFAAPRQRERLQDCARLRKRRARKEEAGG